MLRDDHGLTYPRFLMLLTVQRVGPTTQRALARELGLTEPSVSRSVVGLAAEDLLSITSTPGAGNRREVSLTATGGDRVTAASARLEAAFDGLLAASGVNGEALASATARLLDALADNPKEVGS